MRRIRNWHAVAVWLVIVVVSCTLHVRFSLEHAAETNNPEVYVHSVGFQVATFFIVFGLPLLLLLVLMLFAVTKLRSRRSEGSEQQEPDTSESDANAE